jgi:hypothetical protein
MTSPATYEYRALEKLDAIRIIELQPSADLEAEVQCFDTCLSFRVRRHLFEHYVALCMLRGCELEAQHQNW